MVFSDLIPYFIPAGVIVILFEIYLCIIHDDGAYAWKDTFASATIGIVATLLKLLTKASTIAFFYLIFSLCHDFRLLLGYESLGMVWWIWPFAIIADDFSFYWHHRFSHTIRVLWAAHIMHHSSEYFNFGTAFRNGWIIFFYKPIFWIWMPALGFHPLMVVTAMSINSLYQFCLHSKIVPYLGVFEKVFNTPQSHQLHHASNIEFLDKNHGGIFIFWDKLFGTFYDSRKIKERTFGVLIPPNSYNPLVIFSHEYLNIWRDVKNVKSWKYKFKYIFYPPGWSHDSSRKTAKQMQKELERKKSLLVVEAKVTDKLILERKRGMDKVKEFS